MVNRLMNRTPCFLKCRKASSHSFLNLREMGEREREGGRIEREREGKEEGGREGGERDREKGWDHKGLNAQNQAHRSDEVLCKFFGVLVPAPGDDVDEVIGEHKGDPLTLDTKLALEVPQEVPKVNVDQL